MENFLKNLNKLIIDTLFPIRCLRCGKEGKWICEFCFSGIKSLDNQICGVCEKVQTPGGMTCISCKKKSDLDGMVIAASYRDPIVSKAVHLFKYGFISELCHYLGGLMVKALQKNDMPIPDIVVPIPLHKRRLRWRGFNQSALLAKYVSKNLLPQIEIPCNENALSRMRYTFPQMRIKNYLKRKNNIRGAFLVPHKDLVNDKVVLLVDDIATTGSTIFECSGILKKSGAREVYAVVIARQEIRKAVSF